MNIQTMDALRRWSNLLLSVAQIVVTVLSFYLGTSFEDAAGSASVDPPIVPAGYAFIIWSVIYGGSVAYAIYQFDPVRKEDPLLRRIGFYTASGFLSCCCWLLCVRLGHLAWTVPCILWMAASLYGAFVPLWKRKAPSRAGRLCVIAPISIYSGWLSVAVFANTASVAKTFGWPPAILSESLGSILLIIAATALATIVLFRSGGNPWFAGTILWAISGIGVRNQFTLHNQPVALTAWTVLAAFVVLFALRLVSTLRIAC